MTTETTDDTNEHQGLPAATEINSNTIPGHEIRREIVQTYQTVHMVNDDGELAQDPEEPTRHDEIQEISDHICQCGAEFGTEKAAIDHLRVEAADFDISSGVALTLEANKNDSIILHYLAATSDTIQTVEGTVASGDNTAVEINADEGDSYRVYGTGYADVDEGAVRKYRTGSKKDGHSPQRRQKVGMMIGAVLNPSED